MKQLILALFTILLVSCAGTVEAPESQLPIAPPPVTVGIYPAEFAPKPDVTTTDSFKMEVTCYIAAGTFDETHEQITAKWGGVRYPKPDVTKTESFKMEITCDLKAAIAVGNFDEVYEEITEKNFPATDCKERAKKDRRIFTGAELLSVLGQPSDSWITTNEAIRAMDKLGYLPGKWPGLLAIAAAQPDLEKWKFWVIALGSQWVNSYGEASVPLFGKDGGKRRLHVIWVRPTHNALGPGTRFLGVRK